MTDFDSLVEISSLAKIPDDVENLGYKMFCQKAERAVG
jgi:hypothetical protein